MWYMADITLSSRTIIRPYRCATGSPKTFTYQLSTCPATGVIKVGNVVQGDTNVASNDFRLRRSAGAPNILSTVFYGIAAASDDSDGSTTSLGTKTLTIWRADADTEFLFPTKSVTASTDTNKLGGLDWDSTLGIAYAVPSNSTAGDARIRITEVINPGDTNGYVAGVFLSTATAFKSGAN